MNPLLIIALMSLAGSGGLAVLTALGIRASRRLAVVTWAVETDSSPEEVPS